jgi:hypothetical protein
MMLFRYLAEMGYNDLEVDFNNSVEYEIEKGTAKEAQYKFEFPVIKEWKEKDLREFCTNNIRSTMAGELQMAEMKDKGWISTDMQPVWDN